MLLLENIPLAPLTTIKIGGPARYFVEAPNVGEVQEAVTFAHSRDLPLFVLGGGSNLLVADTGWPGLVLKIAIQGIDQHSGHDEGGKILFEAGAGESWDKFVSHAVMARCAGVECLSGIPGSVGGTPAQNVGAYGQEVAETIAAVQVLDLKDNRLRELCPEACGFSYRTSIFNTTERGRFIVLRVTYALTPGGSPRIAYADSNGTSRAAKRPRISRRHAKPCATSAPAKACSSRREIRTAKAPAPSSRTLCFRRTARGSKQRAAARGLTVPSYPALETHKKVSAAWLVERSGFTKGFGVGRVGISTRHALAIVNRGGATAADVLALKEQIQHRVEEIWASAWNRNPSWWARDAIVVSA